MLQRAGTFLGGMGARGRFYLFLLACALPPMLDNAWAVYRETALISSIRISPLRTPGSSITNGQIIAWAQARRRSAWWAAGSCAALAAFCAVQVRRYAAEAMRSSREARGRCHHCSYDLRESPGRCPECGAMPRPPRASTAGENGAA